MDLDIEKIKAIATIIVTAAVNVANVCGYAFDADAWVNVVLSIISAITVGYAWWKNNNVTPEAQQAQKVLDELKAISKIQDAQAHLDALIAARTPKAEENGAED